MFKASEKQKRIKNDDFEINTVIAVGIVIEGDLIGEDSIRIDGTVKGNIHIKKGVLIGVEGVVVGNINCENIVVFGKAQGNIQGASVDIRTSGSVDGDVLAGVLSVESGGKVNGLLDMNQEKAPILLEQKAG